MEFEFDPWKSESNKAKHGIDFVEAQAPWKSKQILLGAKDASEKRYMVIGTIGQQHWSAIITYRGARFGLLVYENRQQRRSRRMPKLQNKKTTAENLEDKFDQGKNVLDYFDVRKARVINPKSKQSAATAKFSYAVKRNPARRSAVVREKSARYRKKTR